MNRLLLSVAILFLAATANAFSYPDGLDMELSRVYPGDVHEVGIPLHIRTVFATDESGDLHSFYYSEQIPDWISLYPGVVLLNGQIVQYTFEVGASGDVTNGMTPYRWIFDDPEQGGIDLEEGDELIIFFTLIAMAEGSYRTNTDGWFGMLEDSDTFGVQGSDSDWTTLLFYSDPTSGPDPGPEGLRLGNAYPNPFNPVTRLSFSTDRERALRLEILDLRGRRLRIVAEGSFANGEHSFQWDGRDDRGRVLPSGVYLARLVGDDGFEDRQKLTLLK